MSRLSPISVAVLLSVGISGCTGAAAVPAQTPTPSPSAVAAVASAKATPTPSPSPSPSPRCPAVAEEGFDANQVVLGTSNIFAAGRDFEPAPAGGGGGTQPTVWKLPAGASRVITVACTVGEVIPIRGISGWNGASGDGVGPTDVHSYEGIAGIIHGENGMFIVGVFLPGAAPADPAPERLDFTDNEQFDLLEPDIGQVFFVGDGKGRRFGVPGGATRLFLGFADGYLYKGAPGWYGNNGGQIDVTLEVAVD